MPKTPTPSEPEELTPLSEFGKHRFKKELLSFFNNFYSDDEPEDDE